jgi:hypothetical protein
MHTDMDINMDEDMGMNMDTDIDMDRGMDGYTDLFTINSVS